MGALKAHKIIKIMTIVYQKKMIEISGVIPWQTAF
jgi:hypothetical protein